jgi:hypothetical protein
MYTLRLLTDDGTLIKEWRSTVPFTTERMAAWSDGMIWVGHNDTECFGICPPDHLTIEFLRPA